MENCASSIGPKRRGVRTARQLPFSGSLSGRSKEPTRASRVRGCRKISSLRNHLCVCYASNVMSMRNAFAPGKFPSDGKRVWLSYFQGATCRKELTDDYLTAVETLLMKAFDNVSQPAVKIGATNSAMTVIEIRPHRWGWKVFQAPGVAATMSSIGANPSEHGVYTSQGQCTKRFSILSKCTQARK